MSGPDPTEARRVRATRVLLALLVLAAAALAFDAARGDSPTWDEPAHLAAGASHLFEGDFRLADHPPAGRAWAALPLLAIRPFWSTNLPGWREGDLRLFPREWLSRVGDLRRVLLPARAMVVVALGGLLVALFAVGRRLFGPAAALLAVAVAAFDPALIAHGHLVTNDLAAALAVLLAFLALARFLERPSPGGLALLALAISLLVLAKLTALVALPALAVAALVAALGPGTIVGQAGGRERRFETRRAKLALLGGAALVVATVVVAATWGAYGFRFSPFRGPDAATATMDLASDPGRPRPSGWDEAWTTVLHDPRTGRDFDGPLGPILEGARSARLLPEAYLYSVAYVRKKGAFRSSFLHGEYSTEGWRRYFPVAFLVKTPIPTLVLLLLGLAAIVAGRARPRDRPLAIGLATFLVLYALLAVGSRLAIGHRHLLPILPLVALAAGAAAAWGRPFPARAALGLLLGWLGVGTVRAHPSEIAFFNEFVGGSRGGHEWLVDSNLDWGQDLDRLAAWAAERGEGPITLAAFGPGLLPPGFDARPLVPDGGAGEMAPLEPGTYALSATVLSGVYLPALRDAAWVSGGLAQRLARLDPLFRGSPATDPALAAARQEWEALRRARLVSRLRHLPPDERVAASFFVYRLDRGEIETLTRP